MSLLKKKKNRDKAVLVIVIFQSCAKLKPTKSLVNKKVDFHNPVGGGGAGVPLHLNRYRLVKIHVETLETSSKQLQNMRLFQMFVTARQCAFCL